MRKITYLAVLEPDNDGYGVFFPDLPGCVSYGNNLEEAQINAKEALELHVYGLEKESEKISIKEKDLQEILGNKKASHDEALKKQIPGVATGLAWTQVGGEILFIESVQTEGSGKIQITGQLGDVMKESAEIAYTLVKSHFADSGFAFDKKDVHIHVRFKGSTGRNHR